MSSAKLGTCRHCRLPRYIGSRGLCSTCYRDPWVRKLYRPKHAYPTGRPHDDDKGSDLTAEQVEALVAEQMTRLPKWFVVETEVAESRTRETRYGRAAVPVKVALGRRMRKGWR